MRTGCGRGRAAALVDRTSVRAAGARTPSPTGSPSGRILAGLAALALLGQGLARAASATWDGDTSGAWNDNNNWSAAYPNATADIATFSNASPNTTVTLPNSTISLSQLVFDTANAAAYTINSGGSSSRFLIPSSGTGGVYVNGAVTASQAVNVLFQLGGSTAFSGTYVFRNNSVTLGQLLTLGGGMTAAAGGDKVISVDGAGNVLISGNITRGSATTMSLTKSGGGTLTLSGANTYNGPTTLSSGTLSVAASGNLGASAANLVFNGGTLQITGTALNNFSTLGHTVSFTAAKAVGLDIQNAAHTFTADQVLNQTTGGFTKLGAGTVVLNQSNTYSGATTLSAGTLNLGHASAVQGSTLTMSGGSLVFASSVGGNAFTVGGLAAAAAGAGYDIALQNNAGSPAAVTLTVGGNGANTAYAGVLSGAGSLRKIGAGTLTLSGANSFSGAAVVSNGYLEVAHNQALGTTAGATTVASGGAGAVVLANGVTVSGETLTLNFRGLNARGALQAGSGATAEWAGPVLIGPDADTRVGAQANGVLTISGNLSDGGGTSLLVSADASGGKVILSGTGNNYSGQSQIIRGVLELGVDHALPTGSVLNVHSASGVADAALVELNGFDQTVGGLRWGNPSGSATIRNASSTASVLTLHNTDSSSFGGVSGSFESRIEGNLALVKSGAGSLTLAGTNTFTGGVTLDEGILRINSDQALGAAPGVFTINGGTIGNSSGSPRTLANNHPLVLNGDFAADVTANSLNLGTGAGSLGTAAGSNRTITVNGFTLTLGGALAAGTTASGMVKAGGGILVLSGANTYGGTTAVDAGTLVLGHPTDTLADTSSIRVNGGTLSLGTNSDTVGAVALIGGTIAGAGGTLTGRGANFDVRSGLVSAALGGAVGLDKTTAGTVTLSGANTFSGAIGVTDGLLLINGTANLASSVSVTGTGALGGTGSVGAATMALGGTVAPGNSIGTLSLAGAVTLSGTYAVETAADGLSDLLWITSGSLDLSGAELNLLPGYVLTPTYTYVIARYPGSMAPTSVFAASNVPGDWQILYNRPGAGGAGEIWLAEVPEPSVAGLLALAGLLAVRRRMKHAAPAA